MIIKSALKNYSVEVIDSFSENMKKFHSDNTYYVVDDKVYNLYRNNFDFIPNNRLFRLESKENNKSIDSVIEICKTMTNMPSKRNTKLVSIGGGIVQDVTGFVANVLYRGISWTFYHSTLLAACDSCIGSKTSLNCQGFKNLLGTFYPPNEIFIDSALFKTLDEKDFLSGLGEILKFSVMQHNKGGVDNIERHLEPLLSRNPMTLNDFIVDSLKFKKVYIENDEFDKNERVLLNFGHTFGHAFEVSSNFEIPHGTAVALGVVVANRISAKRYSIDANLIERIEKLVHKVVNLKLKPEMVEMPLVMSAIRKDKKQLGNGINAVLLQGDFSLKRVNDVTENEINDAVIFLKENFV